MPTTTRWSASRHSTSGRSDGETTSFRKALQERSSEHCRHSNDFVWYSFLAMPSWLTICSSRFGFRVKRLWTIRFVKPSFGWSGCGGQRSKTVRLEVRIRELEQLKKLCLCYFWLDVSFQVQTAQNSGSQLGSVILYMLSYRITATCLDRLIQNT